MKATTAARIWATFSKTKLVASANKFMNMKQVGKQLRYFSGKQKHKE